MSGYITTGIAICNLCMKPCKVEISIPEGLVSKCCSSIVVHRNVMLKLKKKGV